MFFLLFLLAVTWPGMTLGNRILPLVLGLPFSMVWIASWVVLSFLVLIVLDWEEGKAGHPHEGGGLSAPEAGPGSATRASQAPEPGVGSEGSSRKGGA